MRKILLTILALVAIFTARATVYYVDSSKADNTGNGLSWANAEKDVQAAINDATVAGDEVWVKAATYYPTLDANGSATPTDGRDMTFYLKSVDIKLYGGFAGTETAATQRNAVTNVTILSGDINVGSVATADCYHVVITIARTSACVIDGFTIQGGVANGSGSFSVTVPAATFSRLNGGGIYGISNSSATMSNCTLNSNSASNGGGIYTSGGSSMITVCTFSNNSGIGNTSGNDHGAGIYNNGSSVTISACTFNGNSCSYPGSAGGGIYNNNCGTVTVTNTNFTGNLAASDGGGILNNTGNLVISGCNLNNNSSSSTGGDITHINGGNLTMSNCNLSNNSSGGGGGISSNSAGTLSVSGSTFMSNTASNGGGIALYNGPGVISSSTFISNSGSNPAGGGGGISNTSSITVTGSTFKANSAGNGGGMLNASSSGTISKCTFNGNTCSSGGGSIYNSNATIGVNNSTFVSNAAGFSGGAIENESYSSTYLTNCTLYNNKSTASNGRGGGTYYESNCGGTITNCILWNSTTPARTTDAYYEEINKVGAVAALTVSNSIVRDYSTSVGYNFTATGIIISDPRFVNEADPDGADNTDRTADDGLALQACSPAINAGTTPSPTVPTDILGNSRVGAYDMGAYEYQGSPTNATLAAASTTATLTQAAPSTTVYGDCGSTIAAVQAGATTAAVSGSITANVYVQGSTPTYNGQPYVRRYYGIRPVTNPNTATAIITLYFSQADFNDYNINRGSFPALPANASDAAGIAALRITQQHGSSTTGAPGTYSGFTGTGSANVLITPTSVTYNSALSRWEVTFPVTGFSGFFVSGGNSAPLPVKLLAFTAAKAGSANRVDWATAVEDAGSSFDITRSGNGSSFEKIGTTAGKGSNSRYYFNDEQPLSGVNYYRLTVTDASGAVAYSNIAIVRNAGNGGSVTLAPVPAGSTITITNTDAAQSGQPVSIYSMEGKLMTSFAMAAVNRLDIGSWPAGIYSLKLSGGEVVRIVKQ